MSITLAMIFTAATNTFELPPKLLESVCFVESNHDVNAYHANDGDGNSVGICQVKFKTAQWLGFRGTERELMNPEVNIYYAAKYLRYHLNRYRGDIQRALIGYNRGSAGNLTISYYSNKVLSKWRE